MENNPDQEPLDPLRDIRGEEFDWEDINWEVDEGEDSEYEESEWAEIQLRKERAEAD